MSSNQICGYISLLYSVASKPLELWSKHVSLGGKIRRVSDEMLHGDKVIEILGPLDNVVPTRITAPAKDVDTLNIRLAVLVLVIKNLNARFKLELQITDKKQYRRRFSFLTYNLEKLPRVNATVARVPLKLEECWNTLEINLQILCRVAYGTDYEALQRMIIYPNCRLRRVYLQDRHYDHDETPIELCNAFFDTYMSKRGINFVEKTCQTEEGLSKERDSNLSANNGKTTVPPTEVDLSKDTNKSENLNALGTIVNSYDSQTVKKNCTLLGTLNNKAKMHSNQTAKQQSFSRLKSSINESIVRNELKETSKNMMEKQENQNKVMTHEPRNANSTKLNNRTLHPASSVGISQFLKINLDKTLFQKYVQSKPEFPKHLYPYRIRDLKNIPVTQKNNSTTNTKFGISVVNIPLVSTCNLSGNIGFNSDQMKNDCFAYHDGYAKKNERTINGSISSVTVEENIEDNCTPHLNGKETKPDIMKPISTCLKKDKMNDLISARNFVRRKFFEKLRSKGLIRPQIEFPRVTR